jgi:hypothetical protein
MSLLSDIGHDDEEDEEEEGGEEVTVLSVRKNCSISLCTWWKPS